MTQTFMKTFDDDYGGHALRSPGAPGDVMLLLPMRCRLGVHPTRRREDYQPRHARPTVGGKWRCDEGHSNAAANDNCWKCERRRPAHGVSR